MDSKVVGTTTAGPDGSFDTVVHLGAPVGHFALVADCGTTLSAPIDVVLTSQAGPPGATATILLILLLVLIIAIPRQWGR